MENAELPEGSALLRLRVLAALLVACALAVTSFLIREERRLTTTMPGQPDAASGFVIPALVQHGTAVYLNEHEAAQRECVPWLITAGIVAAGAAALVNNRYDLFPPYSHRRRSAKPVSAPY